MFGGGRATQKQVPRFDHVVRIRDTSFQLQTTLGTPAPSIQDVLNELVDDEARNDLIFDDVLCALE
jgi:hypothetical protein